MTELAEILSYTFIQNALLAGVIASVLCGVVGTFVVVKRLVFASGGISHAAFGGLGLCQLLGFEPLMGAAGAAVACALALGLWGGDRLRSNDALIGVLWSVGMAFGVICLQLAPGYAPNLMALLFGDILTVSSGQLQMALILTAGVLLVIALLFKEFVAVAFDEPFAAVQGVPVKLVLTGLLILIALSVVLLIQIVGVILVIALLSIPPLIGLQLVRGFKELLAVSVSAALGMTLAGLAISYRLDLPSGPAIILLGTGVLFVTSTARSVAARRPSRATTPPPS